MAITDHHPDDRGPRSGKVSSGDLTARVTASSGFSDTVELPFRCRYFTASADGKLKVRTKRGPAAGQEIQVFKGFNIGRLDQIFVTGSDALVIDLWD